ncbi:MAG: hypothetical protein A4E72_01631 [Syntrophus sp. PtaU1.Bin208]|nr:MAG: hypothetical protein A4E72_01631 [Syntrophus sp. PtaU1.Bin208]
MPSLVIRASKATVTPGPSSCQVTGNFRNLYILNGQPLSPSLVCEKRMCRGDSIARSIAINTVTGRVTRNPASEITTSKNRRMASVMSLIPPSQWSAKRIPPDSALSLPRGISLNLPLSESFPGNQSSVFRLPFSIFCASKKSSSRPISIHKPSWLKT